MMEKTLMQCIISYFEVLFILYFWIKERLLHHVEIFRQTGLFSVLFYSSNIWNFEVFHSRMEPGSPERYHLPSDSGLYMLYLLFNLLQNTKDKRRAVCFAQNVFLPEKRFDKGIYQKNNFVILFQKMNIILVDNSCLF